MRVGILGSGFGIYGYLPAVCNNSWTPIILNKSREALNSRREVEYCWDQVLLANSVEDLIADSDRLIVATTPMYQYKIVSSLQLPSSLKHLYLENPIATTIDQHKSILEILKSKQISFSIAYLFFLTDWHLRLRSSLDTSKHKVSEIVIKWCIPKIEGSWKTNINEGGGLLSYYGLHVIALLQSLDVLATSISISEKQGILSIEAFADTFRIKAHLQYAVTPRFSVQVDKDCLFQHESPFGKNSRQGVLDTRVGILSKYLEMGRVSEIYDSFSIEKFILICLESQRTI